MLQISAKVNRIQSRNRGGWEVKREWSYGELVNPVMGWDRGGKRTF